MLVWGRDVEVILTNSELALMANHSQSPSYIRSSCDHIMPLANQRSIANALRIKMQHGQSAQNKKCHGLECSVRHLDSDRDFTLRASCPFITHTL